METSLELDEHRWSLVAARRPSDHEPFFYAVTTTGIFCRPGCSSRTPLRKNVRFFDSAEAAAEAGFRPCQRCKPEAEAPLDRLITDASRVIDEAEVAPSLAELAAALDSSPKTLTRAFKERLGLTPKAFIQSRCREKLRAALDQEERVTDAIYSAGYGASSRFYSEASTTLGMTPGRYRAKGDGLLLAFATAPCSLGRVLVAASDKGAAMIAFADDDAELEASLRERFAKAELIQDRDWLEPLLATVLSAIEEPAGAAAIPLDIRGTAFQQRVWAALRAIPAGETRTYAEIAKAIGRPSATRAVANACGENPTAVAVPCHRVVPKGGGIGGYRWGPERKERLLEREQRATVAG